MTVATFTQPDNTTQTAAAYKAALDAAAMVGKRVFDAFAPHAQTIADMTVGLDAGFVYSGASLSEVASQSTAAITAPVTNPRIDRVVIDAATGAVSVVTGTEAASPAAPAIPAGKYPIAQVALLVGQASITNANITDERTFAWTRPRHRGALVYNSANQSIADSTSTVLTFDSESHDTDAIHSTSSNTGRLTVPSGVTKVRVSGQARFANNGTGNRSLIINKNGATYVGQPNTRLGAFSGAETIVQVRSPVLTVAPGDYFEISVFQTSGGALNVEAAAGAGTWFGMEIVE